jgi:hypothetical protein
MTATPIQPRSSASRQPPPRDYDALGGLCAVLLPGLGHFLRGERSRGIYAFIGIMGMFVGGLFIGGIDVVDRREDRVWFIGQALIGPIAFGVDWVHQNQFKAFEPLDGPRGTPRFRSGYPGESRQFNQSTGRWEWVPAIGARPPNTTAVTTIKDIGTLYCTLAGMLNLIIILDALMPGRIAPTRTDPKPDPKPKAATPTEEGGAA